MSRKPLNGSKTRPLSQHAFDVLASLTAGPQPTQTINPGVIDRLLREDLIEIAQLPSPYVSHNGRPISHAKATAGGHMIVAGATWLAG